MLIWRSSDPYTSTRHADWDHCFAKFLTLHDARDEPERVLAFAREFGVLGICRHFNPATAFNIDRTDCIRCVAQRRTRPRYRAESIDSWVEVAARFRTFIRLAHTLPYGIEPEPSDWAYLQDRLDNPKHQARSLQIASQSLHDRVGDWVSALAFTQMQWFSPPPFQIEGEMGFGVPSLFVFSLLPALVLHLAAWLSTPEGVFICSVCNTPYRADRSPRLNQRHFCSDLCRKKVRNKDANVRYRRRHPVIQRVTKNIGHGP